MLLENLHLWRDPAPRPGPENMAVDDWLLAREAEPILRVYDWEGDWVSLGYFGAMQDADPMRQDGGVRVVRRATGGGIVDHRIDRTYTLVVPKRHELARLRGAESYRVIHEALVAALVAAGVSSRLILHDAESDSAACFEKPVAWDVVDPAGRKLAGAGQRRTRHGLLHQGSVVPGGEAPGLFAGLAASLAKRVETVRREPPAGELAASLARFVDPAWTGRR